MAKKLPKKPKKSKAPKKPKTSAGFTVWMSYDSRYKAYEKREAEKLKTYNEKVRKIKTDAAKKSTLIKKYIK